MKTQKHSNNADSSSSGLGKMFSYSTKNFKDALEGSNLRNEDGG